jgi:nicotinamidase-related amidase
MKAGVLVIDVQRALCTGEYAAFEADRVIERINLVTEQARAAGAPVVFIQHEEANGLFRPGTDGWKLAEGLTVLEGDHHVRKRATDSFHQTELEALLRRLGVTSLVVCGIQSEFCVDTTVRRALALGFPVVLVADGHSTMDNAALTAAQISRHHNLTLSNITSFGPRVRPLVASEVTFEV